MTSASPVNTFAWLVRREYWEYRGGFFWAPIIIGAVFLGLIAIALMTAQMAANQHGIQINGIPYDVIKHHMSADEAAKIDAGIGLGLLSLGIPIVIGLFFVVFFYCLGALYNDRSDRSVLFWKSLPITDTQTVLAKVVAATVIAPVIAVVATILLQLGFLVLMTLFAAMNGINAIPILWSPTHLIKEWLLMFALIPVNALWALPTVGWLLLCSSYVRSKPFLWAVLLPVLSGVLVTWFRLTQTMALPAGWYWKNVVGRLLLSLVPTGWLNEGVLRSFAHADSPDAIAGVLSFEAVLGQLGSPELVIGAAAGAAMVAAAIYFRRKRIEAYA